MSPSPPPDGQGESLFEEAFEPIEIQEEMERSFLDYSMSVIVSRALPDARDGLKPVHRRILWGMHDLGARPDRPTIKCARVTGDVMGKYHPHGDSAIYDALVRMGQSFSLRHPLIHPKGNFGTPDDPPAAARYTECRLAEIALAMLDGIDEDTVDFVDNYSGEFQVPEVLPARFPNLLVNGSQGIAVGMATNIPPHNLGEVIDATNHLIDHPDATPDDLLEFIKGPDFPTGALMMGRQGILDAYRTGRGSIRLRAVAEIEEGKRNDMIVVSKLPYQVSPTTVLIKIKELVDSGELAGIADINNASAGEDVRLEIKLKKDAPALVILNNLYKRTPLQTNFAVNTVALIDGVPRTLNLVQALQAYIDHQVEVIRRRSEFRLAKARDRAHIVEGLIKALDMIDAIIALIRASENTDEARQGLMGEGFDFSEIQANHILDMTLSRLTRLGRAKLEEELGQLRETIADLEAILADEGKLRSVIKEEMGEIRAKHATPRLTELTHDPGEMNLEDLIDDEELVVTYSAAGYIKTVPADQFRTQGRGGRGVAGAKLRDEDYVTEVVSTTAHAYLLFFSNRGKVYRLKAHEIPMKDRTARGTAMVNLLPLQPDEKIQAIIDTRDYETSRFLFFATKNGQVKKTKFTEYDSSRRDGLIAISLKDGDELVRVVQTSGDNDIFIVAAGGQTVRFTEDAVRPMGRSAAGVRGMKLREGDEVVSCAVTKEGADILIVTEAGYGKRTKLDKYPVKGRGTMGVKGIKLIGRKGAVVIGARMVTLDDEILLVSSQGTLIKMAVRDISTQGRDASGVRVMNVGDDETVVALAPVFVPAEEDDSAKASPAPTLPVDEGDAPD
jgi:DNA gyrase subunit A